ncbi:MAG: 4-hydroxy-tetrahydrodipicolinate synthase [Bryocella sp.]
MNLQGCGTALITPFRPDGSLDEAALHAHVTRQVDNGVSLLVPAGTTGEAATLSEQELLRVAETTIAASNGRVPVFIGCTHNSTRQAVKNAETLSRVHGLGGLLSANPYYNKPNQEGQFQHFRAIAAATELPILLYNIPSRTGVNLEVDTVLRLAEIPNIVGIKESSGNLTQISELISRAPRAFKIFSGDDALALPTIAAGGVGVISVASNAIPHQISQMVDAALHDNWSTARRINRHYFSLQQACFFEPNPAPIKTILSLMGRGNDTLRLPMVPVSATTRHKLEMVLGQLGLLPGGPEDSLRVF